MARKLRTPVPRIALTPTEAAAAIGVGPDFFDANIAPELRLVRRGRKRLVPIVELERWVADSAGAPVIEDLRRHDIVRPVPSDGNGIIDETNKRPPAARQRQPRA